MPDKIKIFRYAQLIFKRNELERKGLKLSEQELAEIISLAQDLNMSHDEILESAATNIVGSFE
ncbi:MAG: hypothetical protein WCV79_02640 [Candidatus Paceibacterota bacterium]|jgi:hypothetical protein